MQQIVPCVVTFKTSGFKLFQKLLIAFSFFFIGNSSYAQLSNYCFSPTTGTYTNLTVGTGLATRVTTIEDDDANVQNITIPFSFTYFGTAYTKVSVSSNGWLSFANASPSAANSRNNAIATTNAGLVKTLYPLWDDLDGGDFGGIASYQTTGTSPNRVFTFEWRNWEWNYAATAAVISFQVKLYETSNVIEFWYKQESGAVSSGSASIGLNDATGGSGHFLSLNGPGTSPLASTTTSTDNVSTKPATGQIYRFTPLAAPTITSFSPTSACIGTSITITGTNFSSCLSGVSFNGTAATTLAYVNATTVTATIPLGATTGNITVTTLGGTATSSSLTVNQPPSALTYTLNTASYCVGTAITANSPSNSGGAPTSYSVSPALPAGLSLSTTTGVISGTPTTATAAANYTVTASNSCGSTTSAVNITVTTAPVTVTYSTNPAVYCPSAAITNNTPTTTSGGAPTLYGVSPALPAGLSLNTSTGVISGTPTTVTAAANYTVTASNSCGSTTVAVNITISPAAPSALTYTSNTAIYCVGAVIASNSPSNSGGAPTSYSVSPALPAGLSLSTTTGVISGTPTTATAAANYTVTASNSCGSTTKAVNITVTTAPVTVTYSTNPAVYCPSAAITNNTPTTTSGGAPTLYGVSPALPAGLSLNTSTGVISGTPTTATAAANYTVTASNSCGSTTVAVNITISPAAPSALTYTSNTAIYCVGAVIASNSPSNSGGAPTSYSVSPALPAGLSLSTTTGVISGTPTTATAAANYTVTASNSCGSTTKAVNITVTTAPVTVTYSTNPAVYCPSAAITNNTPTTTSGGAPTLYGVSPALPAGLSLNTSTGVISGTPTTATAAANYTVTASNSCGSTTVAVNITISPAAPSALSYTLTTATYCPGSAIASNSPSNSGGAPTSYSVSPALPAGLSLNTTTGVISGTPTTSTAAANYTVTAINSCGSTIKILNITINAQPTSVTAAPASSVICNGGSVALTAGATSASVGTVISDNFDGTPLFVGVGTTSGNRSQIWGQETSGTNVNSVATFTSPGGGKLMAALSAASIFGSASAATTLTSPVIVTNNYSSLILTFDHTYKKGDAGSGTVEISTNGGTSWTILQTYTTNQGGSTSFQTVTLNLSNTYLNQSNLKIRFNFNSSNDAAFSAVSSWWAVDDVELNGVAVPLFAWTASPSGTSAGLPVGAGSFAATNSSITVTPTVSTIYTVTAKDAVTGCTSTTITSSTITVNPTSVAGSISGAATVCSGTNTTTLTLSGNTGTIQWQSSPNNTTFTNISGATSPTYTATNLTATTYYRAVVTSGVCSSATTSSVTVTVNPTSVAGSISGAGPVCTGTNSTTLTLSGNTGTIQWQSSADNTTFTNISGATSSTYTATNLTATTYYRAVVTSGVCSSATTSNVVITVNPVSVAGSISGAATVCSGTNSTTLTLSGNTGIIQWQSSADNTTFTNISGATFSTYTATNLTATTYYRAVVTSGVCSSATTSSVTITVNQQSTAPTSATASSTAICSGGSTTLTLNGGGGGAGEIIHWYSGSCGGTSVGTGNNLSVSPSTTTTYYGRYEDGAPCNFNTSCASVTITVTTAPSATISYAGNPYCSGTGGTAAVTQTGTTGGAYSSTTGLSINSATGAVDLGISTAGTYTVTYTIAASGACSVYTTTTTITINANTWQGNNTSWNDVSNWSCGFVPTSTTNVIIPTNPVNGNIFPVLTSPSTNSVHNITIQTGASITLSYSGTDTAVLTITGAYANSGSLVNNGKIILKGDVLQNFPGSNATISAMNALEINNSNGVNIDKSFTIKGKLVPTAGTIALGSNFITLKSDSSHPGATAVFNSARITALGTGASFTYGTGRFVIERYLHAKRAWRLVTAPVTMASSSTIYNGWQLGGLTTTSTPTPAPAGSGVLITGPGASGINGLDMAVNGNSSLKTYNPVTGGLVAVANTKTPLLSPGTYSTASGNAENIGYFMFVRGDRNPALMGANSPADSTTLRDTGKVQTGTQTFTFTRPATDTNKFLLLANPYASPVDFGKIYAANSATFINKFWAWDPEAGGPGSVGAYVIYDGLNGYTTPASTGGQNSSIQSTQAVYVQAVNQGTATVVFHESDKSDSTVRGTLFRPMIFSNAQLATNLKFLNADNSSTLVDGTLAQFSSSFSDGVDDQDGLKFPNVTESFSFIRNGKLLTIERRNQLTQNDTLFFNLVKTTQRNYQLEFVPVDMNAGLTAFLLDSYLKTSAPVDMSQTSAINFTVNADAASKAADRFMIVFRPSATLPITFTKVKAYQQGSSINVEWTVDNEINMKEYKLERSADGVHFTRMTTAAALHNNGLTATYASPDAAPLNGINYYRIVSISKSGEVKNSSIVKVTIGRGKAEMVVYPNPIVNGTISLQMINQPKGTYGIRLLNKLGQVILARQSGHEEGSSTETLQMTKAMAHGLYQLEITNTSGEKKSINVIY